MSLAIMFVSNLFISLIFNTITSANDQAVRTLFDSFPIYIFFSAVIIAPFTEELVFRQSIRYLIKNDYLFIIVSGLIFAFAYMLTKEDNVMVPISFHLIHNGLSMALMIIGKLVGVM